VLRPGQIRLSSVVADPSLWPRVTMRNLARNQDACKGAVVGIGYTLRVKQ
jgi:hypothetical protein